MELKTITEVSKHFNISTRTLHYYEKIGLIQSTKSDNYAYRQYDKGTIQRLQLILILRKLRVSLKDINTLLHQTKTKEMITIFQKNIDDINIELEAYNIIKSTLEQFIIKINENSSITIKESLLNDTALITSIESLSLSKVQFKEEVTMKQMQDASKQITKLKDVRIIHLPPMWVASSHFIGEGCEDKVNATIMNFIMESELQKQTSDIRQFGFNNPAFKPDTPHGYESWVTIPEDMEVPKPLTKKHFKGGLYAAHAITFGQFDHWDLLNQWLHDDGRYEFDFSDKRCEPSNNDMDTALEEPLNFINMINNPNFNIENLQLDLLLPIKEK
ncbi:MAG: MerR family transcriptional regulator [Coprobacillaceae bacterium]